MLSVGFNYALGVLFPVFMESFNESRERTGKLNNLPSTLSFFVLFGPSGTAAMICCQSEQSYQRL